MIEYMEATTQIVILMLFNNTIDLTNKISLIYIYLQNIYTTLCKKMNKILRCFMLICVRKYRLVRIPRHLSNVDDIITLLYNNSDE